MTDKTMMTRNQELAMVFRSAAQGAEPFSEFINMQQSGMSFGVQMAGSEYDLRKALAGMLGGIASAYERLADAEKPQKEASDAHS